MWGWSDTRPEAIVRQGCDRFYSFVRADMECFPRCWPVGADRGLASVWDIMFMCLNMFFPPPLRQAWNQAERTHLLPGDWRGLLWPSAQCHQGIFCSLPNKNAQLFSLVFDVFNGCFFLGGGRKKRFRESSFKLYEFSHPVILVIVDVRCHRCLILCLLPSRAQTRLWPSVWRPTTVFTTWWPPPPRPWGSGWMS